MGLTQLALLGENTNPPSGRRDGSGVSRESIRADLWPDNDPQLARRSLNTLLWSLHLRLVPIFGTTQSIVQINGT